MRKRMTKPENVKVFTTKSENQSPKQTQNSQKLKAEKQKEEIEKENEKHIWGMFKGFGGW